MTYSQFQRQNESKDLKKLVASLVPTVIFVRVGSQLCNAHDETGKAACFWTVWRLGNLQKSCHINAFAFLTASSLMLTNNDSSGGDGGGQTGGRSGE